MTENAKTELWKPIPGYDGIYEASNLGRIRTPGRTVTVTKTYPARELKLFPGRRGERRVVLTYNAKRKFCQVHRLMLEAFVGVNDAMLACHNDGDNQNNVIENLRWDTPKGNLADRLKHGTLIRGEKQHAAKLTAREVVSIRNRATCGETAVALSREFGISRTHCVRIIRHESWKHID